MWPLSTSHAERFDGRVYQDLAVAIFPTEPKDLLVELEVFGMERNRHARIRTRCEWQAYEAPLGGSSFQDSFYPPQRSAENADRSKRVYPKSEL